MVTSMASGLAGLALGSAFGVQTGMQRLIALASPLGQEMVRLETLRGELRKNGSQRGTFSGPDADAEHARLSQIFHARVRKPQDAIEHDKWDK